MHQRSSAPYGIQGIYTEEIWGVTYGQFITSSIWKINQHYCTLGHLLSVILCAASRCVQHMGHHLGIVSGASAIYWGISLDLFWVCRSTHSLWRPSYWATSDFVTPRTTSLTKWVLRVDTLPKFQVNFKYRTIVYRVEWSCKPVFSGTMSGGSSSDWEVLGLIHVVRMGDDVRKC